MPRHPDDEPLRILPWWWVIAGLAVAVALGLLILLWLLDVAEGGSTRAALRIEAIRTSLAVVAGTAGGLALVFAARRQWISERAQRHGETVAAADAEHRRQQALAAERDATERRVTDLYANAVNLLAGDRAAVRTAGLYALERLAQGHQPHRQTITEVICAYLRLPTAGGDGTGDDAAGGAAAEAQVRATATRLLTRHLRPDDPTNYWADIRLDLVGASLTDVDLRDCALAGADFRDATLAGTTRLAGAVVDGELELTGARLEAADFDRVRVTGRASFDDCSAAGDVSFADARFERRASFRGADFQGEASFFGVHFGRSARFEHARFDGALNLARVRFGKGVRFTGAVLARQPLLDQTLASAAAMHDWPAGCGTEPHDQDWLLVRAAS